MLPYSRMECVMCNIRIYSKWNWNAQNFFQASFWTANGEKCHVGERQSPIDIVSKDARYKNYITK